MEMYLLALLAITSTTATPLGDATPLCSVVMTYDEINSASPHWSASFQIKTRQTLPPGAILDIKLAGNNTSSSPIPTIVGITINGDNICSTEKVLTTISTYSSKPATGVNITMPITTTTTTTTERSLGRNKAVTLTTTEKYVDMNKTIIMTTAEVSEGTESTDQQTIIVFNEQTMPTDATTTETSQTNPTTPQNQIDT